MNKNKVLLFCVVLMTTIGILWNARYTDKREKLQEGVLSTRKVLW